MPALAEPPTKKPKRPMKPVTISITEIVQQVKAKKKRPTGARVALSHGPFIVPEPVTTSPRFYAPEEILSGSPFSMSELASYFDTLTDGQLRRGWQATLATVLTEEHENLGILGRKEYRGLVRSTLMAINVVHTRFIRKDELDG